MPTSNSFHSSKNLAKTDRYQAEVRSRGENYLEIPSDEKQISIFAHSSSRGNESIRGNTTGKEKRLEFGVQMRGL